MKILKLEKGGSTEVKQIVIPPLNKDAGTDKLWAQALKQKGTLSKKKKRGVVGKTADWLTSNTPESWQMAMPGVSDAADFSMLQQA